ncbi:MATE family efflux transporter [Xylophilus rhododendri]|uniref:MATE family efflux transporter n=2 Tax=Xylophilus rhododendri TaxID=2697032 RepID=A0A857JE18_9BURK|nr:MATE family efflux transporter [Xylophilus rhododendri]
MDANTPTDARAGMNARTRLLLEGPITRTLLKLAAPNILLIVGQAGAGLIETFFISRLGTDALAGASLVFPVVMLMQMMSGGAIGGGIASAIARALGGGRRDDADRLAVHALAIAAGFGIAFSLILLLGGPWLYRSMGGQDASLRAALTYSNAIFAGIVLLWLFNALAAVMRGTGNMTAPAMTVFFGTLALVPLSPLLIFGAGPVRGMGIVGGAIAMLLYYAAGCLVLGWLVLSGRSVVKPAMAHLRLRWPLLRDILKVGLVAALVTLSTNLTIMIATAYVGRFGTAAIAGYGTGSRLEYLLVPLVFGLSAPVVTMVGTNLGAGQRERALRVAWTGAALATGLTELVGVLAALFPMQWLSLFGSDPAMLSAGAQYLRTVGPAYGFFGLGLSLYFASQGAGRLLWPVMANAARLATAAIGSALVLQAGGGLGAMFLTQTVALMLFGLVIAAAVSGGAWFGRPGLPRTPSGLMLRLAGKNPMA